LPSSVWSSDFMPEGIVDSWRLGDETPHNFRFYARSRAGKQQIADYGEQARKEELVGENRNFNARKFCYYLSRANYQREWGKGDPKLGFGTRAKGLQFTITVNDELENRAP
jgi:hypothetical protein